MKRSSKRIPVAAPVSSPGVIERRAKPLRHRTTEPWMLRPQDRCAARLVALAACSVARGPITSNGAVYDADAIEALAHEQERREERIELHMNDTRASYQRYQEETRRLRELLLEGIRQLERRIGKSDEADIRTALRMANLRRPSPTLVNGLLDAMKARRSAA